MSSLTTIAIAGFTGKMSRLITTSLLANHPNITIHGICRSPDKVSSDLRSNPRIKIFQSSSTDAGSLHKGLTGANVCICCYLGSDDLMISGQKTLIDACISENVPRYIASDWTVDFTKLDMGDHPSKDAMKHIDAYLKEKENQGLIKGVHVMNGCFMEIFFAEFLGFVDTKRDRFMFWGTGEEQIEVTTMEDAAKFTAEVAADEGANGNLKFLGDRKSVKDAAKLYQEAYGVEVKVEKKGSLQDLYETMTKVYQQQPENLFAWMGMHYQYYMTSGKGNLDRLDNGRYPSIVPVGMKEFLKMYTKETVGTSGFF